MQVKLISLTESKVQVDGRALTPEELIVYTARVSAPHNQVSLDTSPKLLNYLIKNKHWSPLEMVNMCIEIQTSRAISAQILRHRSFSAQEYSQRYSQATGIEMCDARRQDKTNRQNSIDDLSAEDKAWFLLAQGDVDTLTNNLYQEALNRGIAKECARFLLPLNTKTTLYLNGTIRSWVHYLELRTAAGTQLEHAEVARAIRDQIFIPNFPNIAEALGWK